MHPKNFILLFFILVLVVFYGCGSSYTRSQGTVYQYTYDLVEPEKNSTLLFRDDFIILQFKFDESALRFQLQNISGAPLSIRWDKVSIGVNNKFSSVRNSSTLYEQSYIVPAAVNVPPLGYLRDMIIPVENSVIESGMWTERSLFINYDRNSTELKRYISKLQGSAVCLILPVQIGEVEKEYSFTFKLKEVKPLPPGTSLPAKQRPVPPPLSKQDAGMSQQIVPITIAVGVLGVTVYLLSQKKTSPLE